MYFRFCRWLNCFQVLICRSETCAEGEPTRSILHLRVLIYHSTQTGCELSVLGNSEMTTHTHTLIYTWHVREGGGWQPPWECFDSTSVLIRGMYTYKEEKMLTRKAVLCWRVMRLTVVRMLYVLYMWRFNRGARSGTRDARTHTSHSLYTSQQITWPILTPREQPRAR